MKKRLYVLMLAAIMAVVGITGCSGSEDENVEDRNVEGIVDDVDDVSDTMEEMESERYYSVQSYGLAEAALEVTRVNDAGENETEETGSEGWAGEAGMTIAQLMDEWGVVSIDGKCEGYELLGWQMYETISEVNEDGFATCEEKKLYDGKVFSTEEMMNMELPDADVYFVTVWKLECKECKEEKACEVYYIDDDCYFVCDDCYDSFAKEIGLE